MNEKELNIISYLDKKYKYIARDKNGELLLFTTKPKKKINDGIWEILITTDGIITEFGMFSELFQDIRWEDAEPFKIIRDASNGE